MKGAYRPDVDGLRAIAVTSVVAYHAGIPGVRGGFIGVDIFFVISGFLITRLLMVEQMTDGRIDLLGFYARRARRLLPAFLLVTMACLLLGACLLLPVSDELASLAHSARYASIFLSNVFFSWSLVGGYFDPGVDQFPLLHTWSLAVEEQFYLIWPALLIALAATAKRAKLSFVVLSLAAILFVSFASFAYCLLGTYGTGGQPVRAFYLLWARAWELSLGALAAIAALRIEWRSRVAGNILCFLGIAGLIAAIAFLNEDLPFPGWVALLPTLSACALIIGGHIWEDNPVAKMLSSAPMVAIGLMSYSWYLWHWPLLAIARTVTLGSVDTVRDAAICLLALGLAWLTYRYVENPLRYGKVPALMPSGSALGAAVCSVAGLALISIAIERWDARRQLDPDSRYAGLLHAARDVNPLVDRCLVGQGVPLHPADTCTLPGSDANAPTIVVWGDSHADHYVPAIAYAAQSQSKLATWRTLERTHPLCAPLMDVMQTKGGRPAIKCQRFNEAVLAEVMAWPRRELAAVVLSARWLLFRDEKPFPLKDHNLRIGISLGTDIKTMNRVAPAEGLVRGLSASLERLNELGVPVVILAPVPEQKFDPISCMARADMAFCSVSRGVTDALRADTMRVLREVAAKYENVSVVDPVEQLCDSSHCPVERRGVLIYRDDDHLSASGAKTLAPWIAAEFYRTGIPGGIAHANVGGRYK